MNELDLFTAALSIQDAQARAAYLDEHCQGNTPLRQRLEELLKAYGKADQVLPEVPAIDPHVTEMFTGQKRDQLLGTLIAGRYKLLEEIGEGGMGTVFVAEQTEPVKRKVAVKLIKPGMDSKSVLARFEAERQALAMMDHPNIAKVLDAGLTEERRPYFVMEYIKGLPLTKYCDDVKLSIDERLKLFIQICQAVQHAHQKGIIHRDLKPTNILIALYDGKPVPKVIDFGLAKALHQSLTERTLHTGHEMVLGTPLYMSPEQAELNNLDIDTRSDIYSLGVILYELLTGVTPLEKQRFKEAAWAEVLRIIKEEEPSKPSTKLSQSASLPSVAAQRQMDPKNLSTLMKGDLDWIVMKALEKDRVRRYETANGLAADIQRYLMDEPVSAGPPSLRYRAGKFIKRNRGTVFAAILVVLILLAGICGTTYGFIQAMRSEAVAQLRLLEAEEASHKEIKQRLIADEQRLQAEHQSRLAKATEQFLVKEVLGSADPYRNSGEKVTIEDVIDRAARSVGMSFSRDPEIEMNLREMISRIYLRLGKPETAREQVKAAMALRKKLNKENHPENLITQNDWGEILFSEGKVKEAEQLLRETLETASRTLGEKHEITLASMNNLASQLWRLQRYAEAEQLTRRAYSLQKETLGADNVNTLTSLMNLGVQILDQGRLAEAEPLMEKALVDYQRIYGDKHPGTLSAANNLGSLRLTQKRFLEAEKLFRDTLRLSIEALSDQHPKTLQTINNLAVVLKQQGKYDEIEGLFRSVVSSLKKSQSEKNPWLPVSLDNLASELERQGRWEEATPYLNDAFQAQQRLTGINSKATLRALGTLGWNLIKCKKWKEAEAHYHTLISLQKNVFGASSPELLVSRERLAGVYMAQIKWSEAESLLRDWLQHCVKLSPPWWNHSYVTLLLGKCLLHQKKYEEAEKHLLTGVEELRVHGAVPHANLDTKSADGMACLIQLYSETNKPDEVKKWQAERDKLPKAVERK